MEAYLDNAATTRPFESVREIMNEVLDKDYGNPSSRHIKGFDAERYIVEAKKNIAKTMKVEPKEIYFTSGGTESNNTALAGVAFANKRSGNHIITTCFEHPSVYNPLINLEDFGFRVTYVSVDNMGHVNMNELLEAICDDTILVSIMMVNNEVGAVQDITEISRKVKDKKKDILFHVDAIQSYGKYNIYPNKMGIDLLSISGHKIHASKGIGVLYIKDKTKIKPFILGGGQEKGFRSGTENVPGIAAIGEAAKKIYENHDEKIDRLYELKKNFIEKILMIEGTSVNAVDTDNLEESLRKTAPHVVSVSFDGVKSEVLLHALEDKGVYVSSGSACASNHPAISGTLKAIGVKNDLLDCTLRFSFSVLTTEDEIEYAAECVKELLPIYKKYTRK